MLAAAPPGARGLCAVLYWRAPPSPEELALARRALDAELSVEANGGGDAPAPAARRAASAKRAAAKAASGARLVLRDDGGLGRPLDAAPDKHGRFRLPALSGCELAADDGPTRDAWAAAIRSAIAAPG